MIVFQVKDQDKTHKFTLIFSKMSIYWSNQCVITWRSDQTEACKPFFWLLFLQFSINQSAPLQKGEGIQSWIQDAPPGAGHTLLSPQWEEDAWQGGLQVQLGQPSKFPTQRKKREKSRRGGKHRRPAAPLEFPCSWNDAFSRQVLAPAVRLRALLYHIPALRSSGVLQHRAARGGNAATRNGNPERGVSEPELRQRRVPRPLSAQSAEGQKVRRLRPQELIRTVQLGPGIIHVLRQHFSHHCRWVQTRFGPGNCHLVALLRMTQRQRRARSYW